MATTTKRYVYLVTSGDYSDYRVDAVCSTSARANKAAPLYRGRVERMELNAPIACPEGHFPFVVTMGKDGTARCYQESIAYFTPWPEDGVPRFNRATREGDRRFHVFARDQEHAIKIANERRIKLLAEDRWYTANESGT